MDKVEYKIRADEISALIGEGRYAEAVKLADTIDWKRVKSVTMLCRISDLYKINRRFEESRDVLLMAYEKQPTRRAIVYSLCELAIKMGEFVQAVEYYKEFVRIAPRDTGRYILQYKLYEAQEVSLEERIAVLEELKQHDYRERWAYELAYLYHRVGLTTECIEECDEIFLWFGEGRYVMKALELKMLHEPLSPEQQDRYNRYKQKNMGYVDSSIVNEHDEVGKDENAQGVVEQIKQPTKEIPPITDEVIQAYNAGVSLPEPEATKEIISGEINAAVAEPEPVLAYEQATDYEPATAYEQTTDYVPATAYEQPAEYDTSAYSEPLPEQEPANYNNEFTAEPEPIPEPVQAEDGIVYPHISEIKEPSVDVSAYNTMNLQETLAEGLKEIIGSDGYEGAGDDTRVYTPVSDMTEITAEHQPLSDTEEFIAEFDKEDSVAEDEQETQELSQPAESMQEVFFDTQTVEIPTAPQLGIDIKYGGNGPILGEEKPVFGVGVYEEKPLEDEVPGAVIHPNASYQMPSHFESILSQESDGQISLAVQPEPEVEKQITGQISISEYMLNWEQFKKEQQAKQLQEVKKRVADETGDMFADFDESSKTGLQEKLEKAISDALKQERHDKASGRGDWSVKKEDVINAAVAKVMGDDAVYDEPEDYEDSEFDEHEYEETGYKEPEYEAEEAEEPVDAEPEIEESAEREDDDLSSEDSSKSDYSFKEVEDEEPVATIRTTELPVQEIKKIFKEVVTETLDTVAVRALEAERAANTEEHNTIDEEITEAMNSKESESKYTVEADSEASEDSKSDESSSKASSSDSVEEDKATDQKASDAKESDADSQKGKGGKDSKEEKKRHHIGNREIEERVRTMTPEEKELFGPYIHHKKSRRQIINAIDNLSMDAFTGNAIVTGEEGAGTVNLAKGLIKAVQASDSNFSGKVAKITANTLNKKSTASIFERLANGALIIQRAADLESETVNELLGILQEENKGLIIVMEDTRDDMDKFLDKNPSLRQSFNVRVDIEALDDDSLVAYAKQYAFEREYAIDNLGILALHTRISERQTLDHEVTVAEVKDIIDDAIYYAEKRTVAHFMDVIVRKRYDENDMVILREKDFMH